MSKLTAILRLLRPSQWLKNLVIFTGLIFSANLTNLALLVKATEAFIIFCALSGSCYVINDIFDIDSDRRHLEKKFRPLPAGQISVPLASFLAGILAVLSLALAFLVDVYLGFISLAYFALIFLYSASLKRFIIVDAMVVSLGFVLRAVAGGVVIRVPVSPWLLLCSFLLALFLVLGKRRYELVDLGKEALWHNAVLGTYTAGLLDQMLAIVASATVIAYSLYTFTSRTSLIGPSMMLTIPFVVFGIFRYLVLIHQGEGGRPERVLTRDRALIVDILLWAGLILILLHKK